MRDASALISPFLRDKSRRDRIEHNLLLRDALQGLFLEILIEGEAHD